MTTAQQLANKIMELDSLGLDFWFELNELTEMALRFERLVPMGYVSTNREQKDFCLHETSSDPGDLCSILNSGVTGGPYKAFEVYRSTDGGGVKFWRDQAKKPR